MSMFPLRLILLATVAVAVLTGCSDERGQDLDAACLDNRDRAFGAAETVRREAEAKRPDSDEARRAIQTYISEVRRTRVCFSMDIREQVQQAAEAIADGRILDLGPRPPAVE